MEEHEFLVAIYEFLLRHFNLDELRTLCFRVGVDYDSVESDGKAGKARELILYMKRRDQLLEFTREIQSMRPDIPLPTPSHVIETETSATQSTDVTTADASRIAQDVANRLALLLKSPGDSDLRNDQVEWSKEIYELVLFFSELENNDYLTHTFKRFEEHPEKRRTVFRDILQEALEESPVFLRAFFNLLKERDPDKHGRIVFKTDVSGGTVGQIINVDRLEGGLNINNDQ
jgi:hypothetical protein